MKRYNRIASIGLTFGLLASAFGMSACGSGDDAVNAVVMDATLVYQDGITRINAGQVVFHVTLQNDGAIFSNANFLYSFPFTGGNPSGASITPPYGVSITVNSHDPIEVTECSADIIDQATTEYDAVPAVGAASVGGTACTAVYDKPSGNIVVTGLFAVPVAAPGTTSSSGSSGSTGTSTDPSGPSAMNQLLNTHPRENSERIYDGGNRRSLNRLKRLGPAAAPVQLVVNTALSLSR